MRISGIKIAGIVFLVASLAVLIVAYLGTAPDVRFAADQELLTSGDLTPVNDETSIPAIKRTNEQSRPFFVSGWLPYWAKDEGAASLNDRIGLFTEINPFAYGVNAEGVLVDKMHIDAKPWPQLFADAEGQNVHIIPTILWGDEKAMHTIFSDPTSANRHIDAIIAMLDSHGFAGVDIDYEGKDIADRDAFSAFLRMLRENLSADAVKTLSCTVEARTEDDPPQGFTGKRAMSFANDFSVLNEACDTVRVMAYDQVFQMHRADTFTTSDPVPNAPNADLRWVEEVARYALRYVSPDKLILGIPTYGWEFRVEKVSDGYRYTRVRSVSYPSAMEMARSAGVTPTRTEGGELSFTYTSSDGLHIVTIDDAESVRNSIDIAKKLNLRGVSLFKIDGLTDPTLFDILSKIR
ncbi:MAG: glycosyl hydrolase family 18 protein [Candidatus Moraniibacteriota bacterium]